MALQPLCSWRAKVPRILVTASSPLRWRASRCLTPSRSSLALIKLSTLLILLWNSFDEIDFESLPEQFVLKCTHDSGGLVICKDKSK
ncbi:MAG: hypothetical protein II289_00305, partial [Bacteroidales bacterium]|nr:hypothetical protein [Bacteroidales bacterium]